MIEEREVQFGFTGWHFEQPKQSARLACEAEASHKRISMGIATDPRRTFRCHDGAAFSVTRRRCAGNTAHRARLHPAVLLGGQHLGGRRRAAWLSPHRARRHLPPAMHGRREGQATGATAATYMDLLKTDPSLEQRAIDQPVEPARLMTEIGAPCQLAAPAETRPTGCGPRAFRRQTRDSGHRQSVSSRGTPTPFPQLHGREHHRRAFLRAARLDHNDPVSARCTWRTGRTKTSPGERLWALRARRDMLPPCRHTCGECRCRQPRS